MQLGRLFEGPWVLVLVPIAVAVVIVLVVVSAVNKSSRSDLAAGMNHRSTATIFGVVGIFVLGIVFGPLAIVQASKAEALGVKATAGKVLGWICVGVTALWLIFIGSALASR
ncbi:hypothetical protein [Arthrobacter bambusae]|uniref:hypothetical protein n=1 Tax=Arthrobacter bambusae TaxID=1338426 RepID=UPI00277E8D3F|nr:hypothetical protein [Arthrobacter bambusae]MDQ0029572.1 RsiW-degrading membrane proteinase PrsW (M82 family) [Arthrobacter bambusae]MDQ0097232.1 RsiW-degrading membrane proteinase PrsW (M82 family) [Arthrobacter bambusae]